ncbi:FAD:protein FMN transferase [Oryzomicrobium terrae]|uniref:FAD:protein FMN transferase n=1 Tax=Oryzomicrobium terrae TaxID=1735038 RepID=A0A5C1E3L2_9RHOO|nr:FAD:protein FMN transferase [Oryzomicrobium terrae]QEL63516.1 FAD:protein FMN transferase [Oryzomicrobium terrae]
MQHPSPAFRPAPHRPPVIGRTWRALRSAVLGLALGALVSACGAPTPVQREAFVFGTRVEVLVAEPAVSKGDAEDAVAAVLAEFDRLHRTYHAWQESPLTELNRAFAANRVVPVSAELAGFIQEAQRLTALGNGLFDPGIGQLVALWGFHSDTFAPRLPDPGKVAGWLASRPSIADVTVSPTAGGGFEARSRKGSVALDFGGYLKGVALDRAAAILRQRGISHALINIGGNVMALGDKFGQPWKVGIQHPRQPGPLAALTLKDGEAIGTSGDYQRFFEVDGRRYSHLLDPRTGQPVTHTQAVTVLVSPGPGLPAGVGALSDAASKPIFIAGPKQWRAQAASFGLNQVLRVGQDGRIEVSRALASRVQWVPGADGKTLPAYTEVDLPAATQPSPPAAN